MSNFANTVKKSQYRLLLCRLWAKSPQSLKKRLRFCELLRSFTTHLLIERCVSSFVRNPTNPRVIEIVSVWKGPQQLNKHGYFLYSSRFKQWKTTGSELAVSQFWRVSVSVMCAKQIEKKRLSVCVCVCTPYGLYNDRKWRNIVFYWDVLGSETAHTITNHTSHCDKDKSYSTFICLFLCLLMVMVAVAGTGGGWRMVGDVKQTFYLKSNP